MALQDSHAVVGARFRTRLAPFTSRSPPQSHLQNQTASRCVVRPARNNTTRRPKRSPTMSRATVGRSGSLSPRFGIVGVLQVEWVDGSLLPISHIGREAGLAARHSLVNCAGRSLRTAFAFPRHVLLQKEKRRRLLRPSAILRREHDRPEGNAHQRVKSVHRVTSLSSGQHRLMGKRRNHARTISIAIASARKM